MLRKDDHQIAAADSPAVLSVSFKTKDKKKGRPRSYFSGAAFFI